MMAMFMDDLLGSPRERDGRPALDLVQLLLLPFLLPNKNKFYRDYYSVNFTGITSTPQVLQRLLPQILQGLIITP
jgi:hypothetical protein